MPFVCQAFESSGSVDFALASLGPPSFYLLWVAWITGVCIRGGGSDRVGEVGRWVLANTCPG